jgi:hypothetical protein
LSQQLSGSYVLLEAVKESAIIHDWILELYNDQNSMCTHYINHDDDDSQVTNQDNLNYIHSLRDNCWLWVNEIKGTIQVTLFGKSSYIASLTSTMNGDGTNGLCSQQTRSYTSHTVALLQLSHSFHHKQQ